MGIRERIKQLEQATEGERTTLMCPECGEEFVVYGDAPLEFLAHEWAENYEGEVYRKTSEEVIRLTEHKHDAVAFIDKATGESFLGEFLSSIVEVHRNPPPDLSEP